MVKKCTKCNEVKNLSNFTKSKSTKDGLNYNCKQCTSKSYKKYYKENTDKLLKKQRDYYSKNKETLRKKDNKYKKENIDLLKSYKQKDEYKKKQVQYVKENRERINKSQKKWRNDNYEKYKKTRKKYLNKNKHLRRYYAANRRKAVRKATPKWSEKEKIKLLYEKAAWLEEITGFKYHVDHVIPLISSKICGLHVWNNLQILEANVNMSKSNKIIL